MYPEAGGSSSFARHAFNEFWSFFAAWAQMLNYMITIAISAFFVPHYLGGLFWPSRCATRPGDIIFGIGVVVVLCAINVVGVKESAGVNIVAGASPTSRPSCCWCSSASFLVFSPQTLVDNVHLGVAPTWKDFFLAIPVGMIAYTGIETISNMAEEAKDEAKTIPARDQARRHRGVRDLRRAAGGRAVGAAGHQQRRRRRTTTLLGLPEEQGRLRRRPGARRRQAPRPRRAAGRRRRSTSACSRRRSCSSPPTPASSASRGSSTRWACTARCPTACASCTRSYGTPWIGILAVRRDRLPDDDPGQGRLPRATCTRSGRCCRSRSRTSSVIRLRVTRARPSSGPTAARERCASRGRELPLFAVLGGARHRARVRRRDVPAPRRGASPASAGWRSACVVYVVYRRRQGLDLTTHDEGRDPAAGRRARGRVRVGPRRASTRSTLLAEARRDGGEARRPPAARHPRARDDHRAGLGADRRRRCPSRRCAAQAIIEQAKLQGGRRVTGHWEKVRAGQAGRADRRGGARDARPRDRHAAAARAAAATLFGKTLETVLAERPCRVIIESDPPASGRSAPDAPRGGSAPMPTPRDVHRAATRSCRCSMVVHRRRDPRAHGRAGGGAARARHPRSACCSSPPAPGGCTSRGAARARARGREPLVRRSARLAGALRDHLHARWRARSTSRSASSPTTRSG